MNSKKYDRIKRCMDISILCLVLVVVIPVSVCVYILLLSFYGHPVFFVQKRAGQYGKTFDIYKFRSMQPVSDSKSTDVKRMTRLGKWLRKTSFDELPQLWNVLKGDMSIVGPRPLYDFYVDRYNSTQKKRLNVKPGITGWAQVKGRNRLSWEEKFNYDNWYVENMSLWLDFKILILTAYVVVCMKDTTWNENIVMPEFMGGDE